MEEKKIMRVSPYNLLQEIYAPNCWRVFVCCMMLNLTTRRQVDSVRHRFFEIWPDPVSASEADPQQMMHVVSRLGLANKRTSAIIRMSAEYVSKDWSRPSDLYGLGRYADDSYDIFIRRVRVHNPSDKFLSKYMEWNR